MQNISIGIYSIRLYDSKGNEDIDVEKNEFGISLSKIIREYFEVMTRKGKVYPKNQSVIIIDNILEKTDERISGVIKTGEYGYESELYDMKKTIENLNENDFTEIEDDKFQGKNIKPKTTAELIPFVFSFYLINNQSKKLYLALQRFGQYGIKIKVENELNNFFKQRYPEYKNIKIRIHDLISEKVIKAYYKKEGLTNLTLTRYRVPADIANKLRNSGANPEDFMIEYKIKPKKRGLRLPYWDSIENFINSKTKNINDIIEIKENKELEYNDITAEISIDGKPKKIDFSNFLKFKIYEVINVKRKDNGHPEERELLDKMKEKLKEAMEEIDIF